MTKKKRRVAATQTRNRPVPPSGQRAGRAAARRELLVGAVSLGVLLAVILAGALALSAFRDDGPELTAERGPLAPTDEPGPIHVHGLGVNPGDGALYIATHTGLWRVAPDERQAERVGDRLQDTMGFTIAGPNRFLGSGHPDPRDIRDRRLPPLLGLIESTDAGETWRPISLLGEADFHVLRNAGDRVYGFDATNERLMVSRDKGRTWSERRPPAPVIDLVTDPRRSERVLTATERGLFASDDAGRSWRGRSESVGLLAWPTPNRLYAVDGGGRVLASADAGREWNAVGDIGGQPAALLATAPRELYVALHDGTIKRSANGGGTWELRSSP
jgi:hypothetical protein